MLLRGLGRALLSTALVVTKILDQFTGTNGTDVSAHTIAPTNVPATSWTAVSGQYLLSSNKAVASVGAGEAVYTCDLGFADCTVTANVSVPNSGGDSGIALRVTNSTNFLSLRIDHGASAVLLQSKAGGYTTLLSPAFTVTLNQTYLLKAVMRGTTIDVYVDGSYLGSATSTNGQAKTTHGLYTLDADSSAADDFTITVP